MSESNAMATQSTAQASGVTFELHTLGWEAFQNLCGCVLREILGQTYTVFSSTNDAGQDGAFQGTWEQKDKEAYAGRFVVQCKFTCQRDSHLSLSDLDDELEKAKRLAEAGNAQTYLLMTNAKISGASDVRIREAFSGISNLENFNILGEEWLTEQIRESQRLRSLVPRIYGLGDLSQILDERVYRQAYELLQSWKENLAKFVPTDAHHKSVNALQNKGFVMLLGDPMSGKSTISAALALAAADGWGCAPMFVTDADDFKQHWNPDEPKQFFWVDDAFGQTQYNGVLAQGWNRVFPMLASAIKKGARVIFTSRTNIFNAAKRDLKLSSFPPLEDSQVVVEVENLTLQEKERILYNHLKMGEQPTSFRSEIKPHLPSVSAHDKFLPEIARRLGAPEFTKNLVITDTSLFRFVSEPTELLIDVIKELGKADFAALALIFMRSGEAEIPLLLEDDERVALSVINSDLSDLRDALVTLNRVFVKKSYEGGRTTWKFIHPTIREAMASIISSEDDLLDIYLAGAKTLEIVRECACGVSSLEGAKILIPPSRFNLVLERLCGPGPGDFMFHYYLCRFIAERCSDDFVKLWVKASGESYDYLISSARSSASSDDYCAVLSRLKELDVLDEKVRLDFIESVREVLDSEFDSTALSDEFENLFSQDEKVEMIAYIKSDVLPYAHSTIREFESAFDLSFDDPNDYFDEYERRLENLGDLLDRDRETLSLIESNLEEIESATRRIKESFFGAFSGEDDNDSNVLVTRENAEASGGEGSRSIFDDVDE